MWGGLRLCWGQAVLGTMYLVWDWAITGSYMGLKATTYLLRCWRPAALKCARGFVWPKAVLEEMLRPLASG